MKALICPKCGASEFKSLNGYKVCSYCSSKLIVEKKDVGAKLSDISLGDDISRLLNLCKREPNNAKRYANLVLDIDPNNKEALKYL